MNLQSYWLCGRKIITINDDLPFSMISFICHSEIIDFDDLVVIMIF